MYQNSLRPATLFGLVLLLLGAMGALIWVSLLGATLFDWSSVLLLGASLCLLVTSMLFFRRVRWARIFASVVLHVSGITIIVVVLGAMSAEESLSNRIGMGSLGTLAVGILAIGILSLHNEAMRLDFEAVPAPETGSRSRRRRTLLAAVGVLLILGLAGWRTAPLIWAEPAVTADYVAEANRVLRPVDYDPNRNAFGVFEKFCEGWTPAPEVSGDWQVWPADLNATEKEALRKWAPINGSLLPMLTEAAQRPYWWYELKSQDGAFTNLEMPDLVKPRNAAWGVVLLAKQEAIEGRVGLALDMLADLHMMGVHYSNGPTLVDQMVGLAFCDMTYSTVLAVLDRRHGDAASLEAALRAFRPRLSLVNVPRFCEAERLYGYDLIQRNFTDDRKGGGVLAVRALHASGRRAVVVPARPLSYLDALWLCIGHPDRRETTALYNAYFAALGMAAAQTPWQLHLQKTGYESIVGQMLRSNYFLRDGFSRHGEVVDRGWQARTTAQAFVATVAVLLYKTQKGKLPASLDDLVKERYIDTVPIDPYGGEPFVYRVAGSDFVLYSAGENFIDDGGISATWEESRIKGDRVFWPVRADSPAAAAK